MKDFKVNVNGKTEVWCFCQCTLELYLKIKDEICKRNFNMTESYEQFFARMTVRRDLRR